MDYDKVKSLPVFPHKQPKKTPLFFRWLLRTVSAPELRQTHFKCSEIGMERLGKNEPCLILMNHSSFIDLKIISKIWYPKPFNIVCTYDGFVGKNFLMSTIGCIPTRKFTSDVVLVKDMLYALKTLKSSVLMYPEASYSFDGTETPLPESLGKCIKLLRVPVVIVSTKGAFARDPLYNNLQIRKVDVSAEMKYFLSSEEINTKSAAEINELLQAAFSQDYFKWQQENEISVCEPFRADCLNRVLYQCAHCKTEGRMLGKGTKITCKACGKTYELTETGYLKAENGETEFPHIPDWCRWERACVRKELENHTYCLEVNVDIYMLVNTKAVYYVGEGSLLHNLEGFHLKGCDGKLDYHQSPLASYSLYSDFYWYEIGDMICIGDEKAQYYCFPKGKSDVVAKTRLAAEELYKIKKDEK